MVCIFSLTDAGHLLAHHLKQSMDTSGLPVTQRQVAVYHRPANFINSVQQAFVQGDYLLLICATGIAVRALAPVLQDKHQDPPVLVLDEQGQFVIPLLSGHEGGANEWGRQISEQVNGQLVMTTAKPYLRPVYTVGMGCERNCPVQHLHALLETCLTMQSLTLDDVVTLNSIDVKADEQGLIELAHMHNKVLQTFSVAQLAQVQDQLMQPSDYVYQTVGVYGVAESAALYAAQEATQSKAELILSKQKTTKATCAIARAYPPGMALVDKDSKKLNKI